MFRCSRRVLSFTAFALPRSTRDGSSLRYGENTQMLKSKLMLTTIHPDEYVAQDQDAAEYANDVY